MMTSRLLKRQILWWEVCVLVARATKMF